MDISIKIAKPRLPPIVRLGDIKNYEIGTEEWVKDIVAPSRITMFYSPGGFGKSTWGMWLAIMLADSNPYQFWGKPVTEKSLNVLYISTEDYEGNAKRARDLAEILEVDNVPLDLVDLASMPEYESVIFGKHDYDIVFIDTLQQYFNLAGYSFDNGDINSFINRLYRKDVAHFLLHHSNKAQTSYLGGTALRDGVDRVYKGFYPKSDDYDDNESLPRLVVPDKVKDGTNDNKVLELAMHDGGFSSLIPRYEDYNPKTVDQFARWKQLTRNYFEENSNKRVSAIALFKYCTGKNQTRVSTPFKRYIDEWVDFNERIVIGDNEHISEIPTVPRETEIE